jgi:RHS repeat-associated protein
MGRRIQKLVSTNNGSAYVGEYTNDYVYDGWNCLALLNSSFSLLNSFLWGSDLSGSMQGAGGVGGLIEVSYFGTETTNCFVAFDGNGNVNTLINAASGTTIANYEYDPFGEVIRASGPMAKLNPFRFSTKYDDDDTDLLYYGFRYYNTSTGRFPNRDPLEERPCPNVYSIAANDPITKIDRDGRLTITWLFMLSSPTTCGGWNASWLYDFGFVTESEYLVSQVTINYFMRVCGTGAILSGPPVQWFEAMPIGLGNQTTIDNDAEPANPGTYQGYQSVRVTSRVFPAWLVQNDILQWGNTVPAAGGMSSTYASAPWWWNSSLSFGSATRHTWTVGWNCCCSNATNGTFNHSP